MFITSWWIIWALLGLSASMPKQWLDLSLGCDQRPWLHEYHEARGAYEQTCCICMKCTGSTLIFSNRSQKKKHAYVKQSVLYASSTLIVFIASQGNCWCLPVLSLLSCPYANRFKRTGETVGLAQSATSALEPAAMMPPTWKGILLDHVLRGSWTMSWNEVGPWGVLTLLIFLLVQHRNPFHPSF